MGEGETQELVETTEALDFAVSAVAPDATAELGQGEQIDQLGENGSSGMHTRHRRASRVPGPSGSSNRFSSKAPLSHCTIETYTDFAIQRWDSSGATLFFLTGPRARRYRLALDRAAQETAPSP